MAELPDRFSGALSESFTSKLPAIAKYTWGILAYSLLVILWGAYVRASGSGAGCGAHWPLCNGQVIPQNAQVQTMIEFTHRLMSGATLLFVAGLVVWAWKAYPRGHIVRLGAGLALLFTLTEALLGAGLVLFELVGQNTSALRAGSVAAHLANTFLLLASITLTAWWASGGGRLRLRGQGRTLWLLLIGLFAVMLIGATGAITALGDTLFPSTSLAQGLQQDFSPVAHFLIRLRVIHPFIAVLTGLYVLVLAMRLAAGIDNRLVRLLAGVVAGIFVLQLGLGALNVYLLAPIWMQMVHLLTADLLWINLVLISAAVLSLPQTT
jgi:heme A synthase